MKKRVLSILTALCLCLSLLPTAAMAEGESNTAPTNKTLMLGTDGISGYDSTNGYDYIYYGAWNSSPIKWRVLDDKTNTGGDGLFLLSDVLLGTGTYGGVYFQQSYHYDGDTYYKGSSHSGDHTNCQNMNAWQGSDAQAWCKDFAGEEGAGSAVTDAFTADELGAILATTKSDDAFTSSTYSVPFAASENILNGDKVFFLSAQEAESGNYGFTNDTARIANYGNSAGVWWLRSPYAYVTIIAGVVSDDGTVHDHYADYDWAARPAFNLNLKSVLFTSAAEGGKISAAASGGNQGGEAADAIFEIGDYNGSEWKLTLLDESRNFSVTEKTATSASGGTVTLNYTGATVYNADTAPNEYISVIIADNSGAQYYGRITQPTDASGKIQITIPASLADSTYTLYVFSEQYNGGANDDTKLTDYASAFNAVTLTVSSDTTAPTLSGGSATRDSETSATVKFTSDEAGTYYYAVVESDKAAPTIDTTGTGTACDTTEQTISLNDLSGSGAKDIYIVVKDAAGNVSDTLTITISAYVPPSSGSSDPTYSVTASKADNGTIKVSPRYAEQGETVTITVTPDAGYTLETLTVLDKNGNAIELTDKGNGKYSFKMPAGKVTVNATFMDDNTMLNFFTDVTADKYYYDAVLWAAKNGITGGTTATTFSPDDGCGRGQLVTFLWRVAGCPAAEYEMNFSDVGSSYYTEAVRWAASLGIVGGYGNGQFGAEDTITREQMAVILYRFAQAMGMDTTQGGMAVREYKDYETISDYAVTAIQWAVNAGVMQGYDGNLMPDQPCTRAQIVTMLYRLLGA